MTLRRKRQTSVSPNSAASTRTPKPKSPRKVRTPHHPVAFTLIACSLPGKWRAVPEHLLHHEPQRVDILVILRKKSAGGACIEPQLPSLVSRLGKKATVLEFKGPTDSLQSNDVTTVLGYGMQLAVQKDFEPKDVALGILAATISPTFLARFHAHGAELTQTEPGIWEGIASGFPVFVLELSRVWAREEAERLWYVLTPAWRKDPSALKGLSEAQAVIYLKLFEQYRQAPHTGEEEMKSWQEFEKQVLDRALARRPAEEIMSRYNPDERLQGLRPDERLQGLRPDEVLSNYNPDELMTLFQQLQARFAGPEHPATG
jgi:hypothetical protein